MQSVRMPTRCQSRSDGRLAKVRSVVPLTTRSGKSSEQHFHSDPQRFNVPQGSAPIRTAQWTQSLADDRSHDRRGRSPYRCVMRLHRYESCGALCRRQRARTRGIGRLSGRSRDSRVEISKLSSPMSSSLRLRKLLGLAAMALIVARAAAAILLHLAEQLTAASSQQRPTSAQATDGEGYVETA